MDYLSWYRPGCTNRFRGLPQGIWLSGS